MLWLWIVLGVVGAGLLAWGIYEIVKKCCPREDTESDEVDNTAPVNEFMRKDVLGKKIARKVVDNLSEGQINALYHVLVNSKDKTRVK